MKSFVENDKAAPWQRHADSSARLKNNSCFTSVADKPESSIFRTGIFFLSHQIELTYS